MGRRGILRPANAHVLASGRSARGRGMSSPLRLAVLDCDGTLVNSQRAIIDAMGKAFAEHGLEPPEAEAVRRIVGLELGQAVSRLIPQAGGDTHARVTQSYRKVAHAQRAKGLRDESL